MRAITNIFAAVAVAAACAALPAIAADLDYSVKDQPYDDPRYSDIYRHPGPPPRPYAHTPAAPPPVYRDERYGYPPPPPAYAPQPQPYRQPGGYAGDCLPQQVVRGRLESRGWQDFHDPQVVGNVVHVRARRPNGRLFDLTLDRCSGVVLQAEVAHDRAAEAPPPDWRYRDDRARGY